MAGTGRWAKLGWIVSIALASCARVAPEPVVEASSRRSTVVPSAACVVEPRRSAEPRSTARSVLGEPNLDPEVVARARAALGCDWGRFGPHGQCPAYKDYQSGGALLRTPAARLTFVRMLEDGNDRVRYLGARMLWDFDRKDEASAARVLAAAERETSTVVGRELGTVAGSVDVANAGSFEVVSRIARTHPLYELRVGLLTRLLAKNSSSREALSLAGALANDANTDVAFAAIGSLRHVARTPPDEACGLLTEPLRSGRERIVAAAAREASRMACSALRGDILAAADTALAKTMPDGSLVSTLQPLCTSANATQAERSRGASVAERALKNEKLFWVHRVDAIKAIVACEPKTGAAVVKAYRKDDNDKVRQAAIDLGQSK